ncbi:MAG TPA: NAD(P)-dependent alcohol dehydrogenase [Candidatus Aminicenantes bacterium]|nr:NAD(P)-dependent alcohol dehydrogenase [Candidatus Aminicenantes bacterium]
MKAIVYARYGPPDVLRMTEVEKPVPRGNEVLVKVEAASVNAFDWHMLRGKPFVARLAGGLFRPRHAILGEDVAGKVEAVGRGVTRFKPGDEVFGDIAAGGSGGFAEYVCARQDLLAPKPANLAFAEAAAVPMAAVTALQALRDKGKIQKGKRVLINGAAGGVGTFAVQLARYFGAEVTAVCSARNLEQARSLGAGRAIDYAQEDFAGQGERYDLILGANGDRPLADYLRALAPGGRYIMTGGSNRQIFQALLLGPWLSRGGRKLGAMTARANREDLLFLTGLIEAGRLKPVIDRRYPLAGVADAIRYLEEGHARGKVVITVAAG